MPVKPRPVESTPLLEEIRQMFEQMIPDPEVCPACRGAGEFLVRGNWGPMFAPPIVTRCWDCSGTGERR